MEQQKLKFEIRLNNVHERNETARINRELDYEAKKVKMESKKHLRDM